MSVITNRRDIDFLMYETFDLDKLLSDPHYSDYDREAVTAILDLAQSIAEDKYHPVAGELDANEPEFIDGKVKIMPEVLEALDAYREAGLATTGYDTSIGGMQLPNLVHQSVQAMFSCANPGIASYEFLAQGVANMLNACGADELKARFLPKLVTAEWLGTMCLSETQAGSSLADIRTKAEPVGDGTYKLTGTKMWISAGDHELSDNIIHMVLAKVPGSPAGVKGISLFLVPKYRLNDDDSIGEYNNVVLAGLNHKMGHRGTTNCLLNFGEGGDSLGFLVGGEGEGLANMFHMMNEARIAVGMGAVQSALAGFLYSLDYARNRPQGRHLSNKDPESKQVMISEHADVKRMLMTQKAFIEGAQALIYYSSELVDKERLCKDEKTKQGMHLLLELLTPICKSWPSEYCLEANKLAIQVLGGYGYTREYPVERFYRDNRLNHIHEGTWAIHGLDILGRKVRIAGGMATKILKGEMAETAKTAVEYPELKIYAKDLMAAFNQIESTIDAVAKAPEMSLGLANATLFLNAFGHVVIAWMWLQQAIAATKGKAHDNAADADFYNGKLSAAQFFFRYELPKIKADLDVVANLDSTCFDLSAEQFVGH